VRDVATQLGKEVKFDTAVLQKLKENVNLTIKNVTPEELLTRALKPLGLTFKITADAIEILPAM
jgi:transcription initiation factor TFIIIB Brf1 subunit/transcription initiation factor TFIIB